MLPPGGRRDEPVSESTAIVDQWTEPDAGIREPAAAKVGTVPAAGVASRADGDPWTDPAPPEAPEDAEVFLAGPLPGEPRRTRVRLGLWTGTIVLLFVFALVLWR